MNGLSASKLPRRINGLDELAYNLWWSWHSEARNLFKVLDRPLWKATGHNPIKLLQQIPPYRLIAAAQDPAFLEQYDPVMAAFETDISAAHAWFPQRISEDGCQEEVYGRLSFPEALNRVRATTVFTTHTPVPAGNDAFSHDLMGKYFHRYWGSLGLDQEAFLRLGTVELGQHTFNMTALGLRMSQQRNGVSQLHGAVCRRMWHCLWPGVEEKDVPIASVTNGVHTPTWVAPQMGRLYEKYLAPDWLKRHDDPALRQRMEDIPDAEIWEMRRWFKGKLISSVRDRARKRWGGDHGSPVHALAIGALLDTEALTLGFSRRFTDYKRAALLFHDIGRLKRILRGEPARAPGIRRHRLSLPAFRGGERPDRQDKGPAGRGRTSRPAYSSAGRRRRSAPHPSGQGPSPGPRGTASV